LIPELCRGTAGRVDVILDLLDIELPPERAIPCGLVVSELATNTLTHALPHDRRGSLHVQLERLPPARLRLTVKDDGVGLKREFPGGADATLGLDLVAI